MLDWNEIASYGIEMAPAAFAVLAAVLVIWLVWRLVRGALRLVLGARESPADAPRPRKATERREPVLGPPAAASVPSRPVPDAADVLALKASIDALTRQIASLEKKLTVPPEAPAALSPSRTTGGEDASRISVTPPLSS
ncbi:hypothetical protein [Microvirga lenta]|uniref:hypothetical protein n=1 Tax=Microvirga lenta TaxID=2881337 RepID=UPI001CFFDC22|nr:hypothetical protein [Microvirga lenta]MCB5175712.1 hypothetical protein [Microvirga lenta]